MADKDEADSTEESSDAAVDPTNTSPHGSHAIEPAVDGVPADANEPTFRDRERMAAEGEEPDEDPLELVTVGAPSKDQQIGSESDSLPVPRGRQKKDKATPRQKQAVDKDRRTGPVTFLKESVSELQKVVYPTGNQLINYFVVVLIFVLFIIAIVSLLDLAFGKAIIAIFS